MRNSMSRLIAYARRQIEESCQVKHRLSEELLTKLCELAEQTARAVRDGYLIFLCGNGGSAADAQHIAAELVGRFGRDRRPLPALALTTNTSILTALGNDLGFEEVFSRQVDALAKPGDIIVGISTSGNSPNVLRAIEEARRKQVFTVGLTGESGGKLKDRVDLLLNVPSSDTQRIQEAHILLGHIYCGLVESLLCNEQ